LLQHHAHTGPHFLLPPTLDVLRAIAIHGHDHERWSGSPRTVHEHIRGSGARGHTDTPCTHTPRSCSTYLEQLSDLLAIVDVVGSTARQVTAQRRTAHQGQRTSERPYAPQTCRHTQTYLCSTSAAISR
jgi:hypothetical protein